MNPDLLRLTPGIAAVFTDAGFTVNVTEVDNTLAVTVSRGEYTETRNFVYPAVNRDLSIPLQAWKASLITANAGA